MNDFEIRNAIGHTLSGFQWDGEQRAAVMEKIHGGRKMKRKFSAALALALVLTLMTVTALAVSNWESIKDYLAQVRHLERETKGWPLSDRLRLVELMHEAGIEMNEEAYQSLQRGNLTEEEKIALSDEIIEGRYGQDWQWTAEDVIRDVEWPVELRYQTLENVIEYEKWLDEQERAERNAREAEDAFKLLDEAAVKERFKEFLTGSLGFTEESLKEERIKVSHDEEKRIWQAEYLLTSEEPGWHRPTEMDQMNRITEEMTMLDYIRQYQIAELIREKVRDRQEIPIVMSLDDWGRDAMYRMEDMEDHMILAMADELTSVHPFRYDSIEADRITVSHDEETGLWTAAYTIDAEHPGVYEKMEGEIVPDTVYEYECEERGYHESFTYTCQRTDWNRWPGENPQPPEEPGFISEAEAVGAAKEAIMEKYGCTEESLDEMRQDVSPWETDGVMEYYIEFVGYDYFSSNFARLFNYAARVDRRTGEVIAAVSREDWEPMTDRRLIVDDTNRERVEQDRKDWALRQAAGETGREEDRHLYYSEEWVPFAKWTLEEKAAYSEIVKPRIDAFLEAHPEDLEYYLQADRERSYTVTGQYIATTRHRYGLPDENAISQDEAYRAAVEALAAQYGIGEDILDNGAKEVYYDISDPARPLWKFYLDFRDASLGENQPWALFAAVDASTGEIVITHERPAKPSEKLSLSDFM